MTTIFLYSQVASKLYVYNQLNLIERTEVVSAFNHIASKLMKPAILASVQGDQFHRSPEEAIDWNHFASAQIIANWTESRQAEMAKAIGERGGAIEKESS